MTPALKQRLVGAAVLVALAVIFLPMLLDGSGARENFRQAIAIPPEPEAPASQFDSVTTDGTGLAPGEDQAAPFAAPSDGASATEKSAAASGSGGVDAATTDAGDDQGGAETAGGNSSGADEAGSSTAEPSTTQTSAVTSGWVVQVGSFRKKTNAIVLRDKLRDDDLPAKVDQGKADGATLWRVRLGPVARRDAADALLKRFHKHHSGDALVMAYP